MVYIYIYIYIYIHTYLHAYTHVCIYYRYLPPRATNAADGATEIQTQIAAKRRHAYNMIYYTTIYTILYYTALH